MIAKSGSKRWVSAVDPAARAAGLKVGIPAAKAQAIFRGLLMIDADPVADLAALERITFWALGNYSPIVAVDAPSGIVMDTEGADHLQGGEQLMLTGIANRFRSKKLAARVAIADTWGAAHACARAIQRETVIVPIGETVRAVENLPLSLLRLPAKIVDDLHTLGFKSIGELSATPRAPLALRFGPEIGRRIDQMFGRVSEPINPIRTPDVIEVSRSFAEPIGSAETINKYVGRLVEHLVIDLQKRGLGVRRTDLIIEKVDGTRQAIRAGTAKPARDVACGRSSVGTSISIRISKDRIPKNVNRWHLPQSTSVSQHGVWSSGRRQRGPERNAKMVKRQASLIFTKLFDKRYPDKASARTLLTPRNTPSIEMKDG